ncbi:MAG: acyltransferase [Lachnospiraceae bacterium]|nr:acyltransferase [Lachnospiraceae bacterium]
MQNLFITNLHKKDLNHFTTDIGLFLRRKLDKPFKKACNIFTNANIIRVNGTTEMSDEDYYASLDLLQVTREYYPLLMGKKANNIVVERYPKLEKNESYIFVGNHTCPEDIETMLNIIDRNAYLILGSVETLKYDPEMYLSWLNGMIVFDILDDKMRKGLIPKMERVLRTNSILIFPEGSHNYHPSRLVNTLFDGPVNLALKTGKKIVPISLVRDDKNKVSYIDVCNAIDIRCLQVNVQDYFPRMDNNKKYRIKALSSYIRDKMATSVYHLIARHIEPLSRNDYEDIEAKFIENYVNDAFKKLKWRHDVFDAEYLIKKSDVEKEYEEIIETLGEVRLKNKVLKATKLNGRYWYCRKRDLEKENVVANMRKKFIEEVNYNGIS